MAKSDDDIGCLLLTRWLMAYEGYALTPTTKDERKELATNASSENVGVLVNQTRKFLTERYKDQRPGQ